MKKEKKDFIWNLSEDIMYNISDPNMETLIFIIAF